MSIDESVVDSRSPTSTDDGFTSSPRQLLERVTDPVDSVVAFLSSTRGQFDDLTRHSDPMHIEASDIVAVSMVGSCVPPAAAAWILGEEGQWLTTEILSDVAPDASLVDCNSRQILRIADLFHLIRRPESQIPVKSRGAAIGQACSTRILAAKRPGLVPIDDRQLRKRLGYSKDDAWWRRWKATLDAETCDLVSDIRAAVSLQNPVAAGLSDLRILDILIRS